MAASSCIGAYPHLPCGARNLYTKRDFDSRPAADERLLVRGYGQTSALYHTGRQPHEQDEFIIVMHSNGAECNIKLRFLKDKDRARSIDSDIPLVISCLTKLFERL